MIRFEDGNRSIVSGTAGDSVAGMPARRRGDQIAPSFIEHLADLASAGDVGSGFGRGARRVDGAQRSSRHAATPPTPFRSKKTTSRHSFHDPSPGDAGSSPARYQVHAGPESERARCRAERRDIPRRPLRGGRGLTAARHEDRRIRAFRRRRSRSG